MSKSMIFVENRNIWHQFSSKRTCMVSKVLQENPLSLLDRCHHPSKYSSQAMIQVHHEHYCSGRKPMNSKVVESESFCKVGIK